MKRNTLRFILRVSVLTFNKLKMKKLNLLTLALIGGIVFWSSCSKSSDSHNDHGCHECHIAMDNPNYVDSIPSTGPDHFVWHLIDFTTGEEIEFCGDDLELMEGSNWSFTIPAGHFLLEETTGDTLHAGTYNAATGGYESHCHE